MHHSSLTSIGVILSMMLMLGMVEMGAEVANDFLSIREMVH